MKKIFFLLIIVCLLLGSTAMSAESYNPPVSSSTPPQIFAKDTYTDAVTGQKYTITGTKYFSSDGKISYINYAKTEFGTNKPISYTDTAYYYDSSGKVVAQKNVMTGSDHATVVNARTDSVVNGLITPTPTNASKYTAPCDITSSKTECYTPISEIIDPSTGKAVETKDFPTYLQAIYRIGIGACFVLGVIMFTWAGIEYIITESISGKSGAKSRIVSALTGLAIALVSYILLNTINPDILKLNNLNVEVQKVK